MSDAMLTSQTWTKLRLHKSFAAALPRTEICTDASFAALHIRRYQLPTLLFELQVLQPFVLSSAYSRSIRHQVRTNR